jgi:metal-dependent hydrolase (beta-lactamase superfamily II)
VVRPGDYADAKEFLNAAKSEGIEFIIVDSALEVAPNLFATGPVERVVEKFNGPQGIFIKDERSGKYTLDIIHDDQSLGYKTNQPLFQLDLLQKGLEPLLKHYLQ